MAKHRRSPLRPKSLAALDMLPPQHASSSRRRAPAIPSPPALHSSGSLPAICEINVAPMPGQARREYSGGKMSVFRAAVMLVIMIYSSIPMVVSWVLTMAPIFGGCCSNVFTLEAIVKEEPESGLLITFAQFIVTTLFTLPTHFSIRKPPFFLKTPAVPLRIWIPNVILFFAVNMLNNFAFGYNISVPVHIILRSGGSVTTMIVGFIWGKRFTKRQVLGVSMLTMGVILAAMADAEAKGKASSASDGSTSSFLTGLSILFVAQILSAIMGLYTQSIYATHGPHPHENLFYSHILSLPLFTPFFPRLTRQFSQLWSSRPMTIAIPPIFEAQRPTMQRVLNRLTPGATVPAWPEVSVSVPIHVLGLLMNSLTQYVCIRGVTLLGGRTSALGVTIMLNLRKLVSLFLSIWLFGNELPVGVLIGAAVVFAGAAVYGWQDGRRGVIMKRKD